MQSYSLAACAAASESGLLPPGSFGSPGPQKSGASQRSFVWADKRPSAAVRHDDLSGCSAAVPAIRSRSPYCLLPCLSETMATERKNCTTNRLLALRSRHQANDGA